MNIVMTDAGEFIEIQGTAEGIAFTREQMNTMLDYANKGINELIDLQNQALEL
jgi:ribonuclease PH